MCAHTNFERKISSERKVRGRQSGCITKRTPNTQNSWKWAENKVPENLTTGDVSRVKCGTEFISGTFVACTQLYRSKKRIYLYVDFKRFSIARLGTNRQDQHFLVNYLDSTEDFSFRTRADPRKLAYFTEKFAKEQVIIFPENCLM